MLSVSPRLTWYSLPATPDAFAATGAAGFVVAGDGKGLIAGAAGATTDAGLADWSISGGSSKKVYSLTTRPEPQLNSTRKCRKGSVTGRAVVSLRIGSPVADFSISMRRSDKTGMYSMPASLNASGEASLADSDASSAGVAFKATSAFNCWPMPEKTLSLPSPAP
ncbi:MAG: hypothetical protein ACK4N6_01450 [Rhodocyclaceae bacterium]